MRKLYAGNKVCAFIVTGNQIKRKTKLRRKKIWVIKGKK